jgi:hypothetical protein
VNVGQNTTAGDGHIREQAGQLLIVADCQLNVARDDASLLVVCTYSSRHNSVTNLATKNAGAITCTRSNATKK